MGNTYFGQPTYGSSEINSQLVPTLGGGWFIPGFAPGPSLRGGARPPQTIPTGIGATLGDSGNGAAAAAAQPFSFRSSPLPLLLGMLIVGLLGLRYIHWRD